MLFPSLYSAVHILLFRSTHHVCCVFCGFTNVFPAVLQQFYASILLFVALTTCAPCNTRLPSRCTFPFRSKRTSPMVHKVHRKYMQISSHTKPTTCHKASTDLTGKVRTMFYLCYLTWFYLCLQAKSQQRDPLKLLRRLKRHSQANWRTSVPKAR